MIYEEDCQFDAGIGDTFFEINFFQDADEEEYQISTYGAMLWALTETEKQ